MENFNIKISVSEKNNALMISGNLIKDSETIKAIMANLDIVNENLDTKLLFEMNKGLSVLDNSRPIYIVFKIPVLLLLLAYLIKINEETKVKFIVLHSDSNFDLFYSMIQNNKIDLEKDFGLPSNPKIDKIVNELEEMEDKSEKILEVFKNFSKLDNMEIPFEVLKDKDKFEIIFIKNMQKE